MPTDTARHPSETARRRGAALLLPALLLAAVAVEAAAPVRDVRIVVDVSGSMRHTDPDSLRVPALRLLTGLMPGDAHAGVWTFGRHVNMLVAHGPVDDAWRDAVGAATREIHSAALHTNIEGALETATWNWRAPDAGAERHLILFTDGRVDLPDGAAENAGSQSRITGTLAPRLRAAGVRLHTIALSDETDEALLRQLAAATGGIFEKTREPAELERIFARLFARAVESESLPLTDRRFLVDDSISELTILAFREHGAPPARLTMPSGTIIEATAPPRGVRWHSDLRYDLVTIQAPRPGTWEIDAALDPDDRIMVVSRLRLDATRLPAQLLAGDRPTIEARLSDDGRTIAKREFLHFVRVETRLEPPGAGAGDAPRRALLDNGRNGDALAGDGIHTLVLADELTPGRHELTIDVDGTTFRRTHRQTVEVVTSPVTNGIVETDGRDVLVVIPNPDLIDVDSLRLNAIVTAADGTIREQAVPRTAAHEWRLDLGPGASGRHRLALDIEARRHDGSLLRQRDDGIGFGRVPPAARDETSLPTADIQEPDTTDAGVTAQAPNWILVGSSVLAINLALIALLWVAWRRWIDPPPARAAVAEAEAESVAPDAAAPTAAANDGGAEGEAADAAPAIPSPAADDIPDPAPAIPDEEIVIQATDFDDVELDFGDDDRKRSSA